MSHRPVLAGVPTTNPAGAVAEIEEFDAPNNLTATERAVWLLQAPHAFKARTLTRAMALSFERYCRLVVTEMALAQSPASNSGPNHRGVLQRINALELQFMLTPCGKAIHEAADQPSAPANPVDRFLKRV